MQQGGDEITANTDRSGIDDTGSKAAESWPCQELLVSTNSPYKLFHDNMDKYTRQGSYELIGHWEIWIKSYTSNFQVKICDWWLRYLL